MPERPGDMDERDVDARFASIVARWDGPVPAADEAPDEDGAPDAADAAGAAPPLPRPPATTPRARARSGRRPCPGRRDGCRGAGAAAAPPRAPRGSTPRRSTSSCRRRPGAPPSPPTPRPRPPPTAAEAALDDEHFEPPEVVLPPQEDLHFWGAVIGLVAGPLMLLWVVFARPFHSTRWFVVAIVVSLVGFGLLILRQPRHRDPTSGDDGARV